jgi:2,3-dihydroxybiphenyl 1,2-dioxygenase
MGVSMHTGMELAYLGIAVPDPSGLSEFFADVIGLIPGEPAGHGALTWRNDARAHRIIVESGEADDAVFLGVEAVGHHQWEAVLARLEAAGFATTPGNEEECRERRVKRLAKVTAPWGVRIELVEGLQQAATAFASDLMPGGFLTEGVGWGHVVFATTEFEASHRFVVEGLGFTQSDWLEMEIVEGIELLVRFYHCNERHHSLALAKAPFELPQRLHHLMVEARERDDVGHAFDRAWASGLGIPNGLGRHDNDQMFSFYVQSPAGFQVEVGYGARLVQEPWQDNRRYDRISSWGHQPLRSA